MDCEKECYWNYENVCVHEDEQKYDEGNPLYCEVCPNWLRKDFDKYFHETHYRIIELLNKRNCSELEEIEKFIISQREKNI